MSERVYGFCKWFNEAKGYGFVTDEAGTDHFVHFSDIEGDGFRSLEQGAAVTFVPVRTQKGWAATSVQCSFG